jgi:4-hydroxy-tetrahydrodipicolinate reductase
MKLQNYHYGKIQAANFERTLFLMVKLIISGCNGKMGETLVKAAKNFENCEIVGGIDFKKSHNYDFPVFAAPNEINVKCDAIIDFSSPAAIFSLLNYASANLTSLVLGTTGYSEVQINKIRETSEIIPIFLSQNMSFGVYVLAELAKNASKMLGTKFDIEIIEQHHNQKVDAPSGTALLIAEKLSKNFKKTPNFIYERHSLKKAREKSEIGIHSIRGGNINGDHTVLFAGEDETITISHHASSKKIFAFGAINAALFVKNKNAGLYKMSDIFNC